MRQLQKLAFISKVVMVIFFSFSASGIFAQHVEIDRIDIRGNKVIVWYVLNDPNDFNKYSISLFSSLDRFASPLTKVSGDVGKDVKPGRDNKIIWDITNEIGNFKGSVVLEVRGNVAGPFVQLASSDVRRSFKRGKIYPITWRSGNLEGQVNIQLYNKDEQLIWEAGILPNAGKYEWTVSNTIKKGNYRFKFINVKDPGEFQYSNLFAIRPRTPMGVKVAGVLAVIGGGVAVLSGGKGGTSSRNDLPDPPSTPGN